MCTSKWTKAGHDEIKKKTYHSNGLLNKQNTPSHLCGICDVFLWCSSTFQLRQRQSVNEIVKIIATLWISFYLFSLALHCMRCTRKWSFCQQLLAPNIVIWTYNNDIKNSRKTVKSTRQKQTQENSDLIIIHYFGFNLFSWARMRTRD